MLQHVQHQEEDQSTCLVPQRYEHTHTHWDSLVNDVVAVEVRDDGGIVLAAVAMPYWVGVVEVPVHVHVGTSENGWSIAVWSPECAEEMQEGGFPVCSCHPHCHI